MVMTQPASSHPDESTAEDFELCKPGLDDHMPQVVGPDKSPAVGSNHPNSALLPLNAAGTSISATVTSFFWPLFFPSQFFDALLKRWFSMTQMPYWFPRSDRWSLPFDPLGELRFRSPAQRLDLHMHLAGCYALLYFLYRRRILKGKLQMELDDLKQLVHHLSQENNYFRRHIHNMSNTRAGRHHSGTHTLYQLIEHDDMIEVPRSEISRLWRRLAHSEQEVSELREQKRQVEEEYRLLASRMERVESLHAQQFQADSGSYQDSTPTPPLLQAAADAAKDAIISCASDLYTITKSFSIAINLQHAIPKYKPLPQVDPQALSKPTFIKKALQEYFLNLFFKGFESATFSSNSGGDPPFQKPENRKKDLFQEYKDCRYMDPENMFAEDAQFREFVDGKVSCLLGISNVNVLMMGDSNQTCGFIRGKLLNDPNSRFYKSFLRLARAVWVLHKLAFAFEPSAEIFRVGHGSIFYADYMEDLGQADEDECDDTSMNLRAKNVELVCAPGFTVRNSVVKARVWLSELHSFSGAQ